MKKTISSIIIAGMIIGTGSAVAGHAKHKWKENMFTDRARVTHVEPIYRMVEVAVPREECHVRKVRRHSHHNEGASTVIGGIIGGAVGHHLGNHRKGPTVAGAIVGAAVGNTLGKNAKRHDSDRYREVCETHTEYHTERQLDGYDVTYKYRGEFFTTRMDRHPGKRIKVKVHVSPVVY